MSISLKDLSHRSKDTITKSNLYPPVPINPPSALPNKNPNNLDNPTIHSSDGADDPTTSNLQFTPFFTLIEDIHTTHHHHPTVHYIFSDDSTDLITEAALRTLEPHASPSFPTPNHQHLHKTKEKDPAEPPASTTDDDDDDNPTEPPTLPLLPPPRPGITDRYILLDLSLSPSHDAVLAAHAHSLTSDWQVLNVEVSHAPTWDADPDPDAQGTGAAGRDRGLMLKIEGTEGVRGRLEAGDGDGDGDGAGEGEGGEVDMEGLVGVFERRMGELRRLIGVEAGDGDAAGVGGGR